MKATLFTLEIQRTTMTERDMRQVGSKLRFFNHGKKNPFDVYWVNEKDNSESFVTHLFEGKSISKARTSDTILF